MEKELTFHEQVKIIKKSKLVHKKWYAETYKDVAILGMDAAEHYLKYGALLGRNPGKTFETEFYLESYEDVKLSGINPLVHYVLYGQDEGRLKSTKSLIPAAKKKTQGLRRKLQTLGFTKKPLEEMMDGYHNSKNRYLKELCARELALWSLRLGSKEGYREALKYLEDAKKFPGDRSYHLKLTVVALVSCYHLGNRVEAHRIYHDFIDNHKFDPDVELAYSNFLSGNDKLESINNVLKHYSINPITISNKKEYLSLRDYDKIFSQSDKSEVSAEKETLVTVLIAAYNAEDTLETTLKSLQQQTWKNLEILVLDDYSLDRTCDITDKYSKQDERIKLIRMPRNNGAYIARNYGLDIASGDFVTIHDADDWSHPDKIRTQVDFLINNKDVIGCTSQQARADSDLMFLRWTGDGKYIITNTSSFMFRKKEVKEKVGCWDTVRFGADNEFIRRIKKVYGEDSVVNLETGPLSFQRDSDSSIVAHEYFGINGAAFGVRQEYIEAQSYHHETADSLLYDSNKENRPFYAPLSMRGNETLGLAEKRHFDVIIASDFRMFGGSTLSNVEEIKANKRAGLKTGIFQMYRYDFDSKPTRVMLPQVREQVDGDSVEVLVYGEEATCDLLILRYPPILEHHQRFMPKVDAKEIKVIVNQPPMSDYTENGVERYKLENCARNILSYFGKEAVWHPIGPLVRDVLHQHHKNELKYINLSDEDWHNIIDIEGWKRGRYTPRKDCIAIGRHSRDHFVKWPESKKSILTVYPEQDDVEVRVLGGASAVSDIVGYIPNNWKIYEFGEVEPKQFLSELDVFVYYSHPDWIESFGRVIIEAMASGVPVFLPEVYKPLFGEAAIYSKDSEVVSKVKALCGDAKRYEEQVEVAYEYIRKKFCYERQERRVNEIKEKYKNSNNEGQGNVRESWYKVPGQSGKVSGKSLSELRCINFEDVEDFDLVEEKSLYVTHQNGFQYDLLLSPKAESKKLFVLFSGDAMRSKNSPPVFQRWTWDSYFPGHVLFIADPSLYMHEKMGLCWYVGTSKHDHFDVISKLVVSFADKLGVKHKDIVSYGSSGGGFASIRLSLFIPSITSIAINPQTEITQYERKNVERYLDVCFEKRSRENALNDFPDRLSLLKNSHILRNRRIIYAQNNMDYHHYDEHFKPFCQELGFKGDLKDIDQFGTERFKSIIFSHEGGHTKAETPEVFTEMMNLCLSY